jgi:hypothetical protein
MWRTLFSGPPEYEDLLTGARNFLFVKRSEVVDIYNAIVGVMRGEPKHYDHNFVVSSGCVHVSSCAPSATRHRRRVDHKGRPPTLLSVVA